MTSNNIIPFRAMGAPERATLAAGCTEGLFQKPLERTPYGSPAAASYSPIGNPSFDPVLFNDLLFQRELDAVREVMK